MKRRVPWICFLVSLAFNLTFLLGFQAARGRDTKPQSVDAIADLVARELKLDSAQRQAFVDYRANVRSRKEALNTETSERLRLFRVEMVKDDPDMERVASMLKEYNALQYDFGFSWADQLRVYLKSLTPEQREKHFELIKDALQRRNLGN